MCIRLCAMFIGVKFIGSGLQNPLYTSADIGWCEWSMAQSDLVCVVVPLRGTGT